MGWSKNAFKSTPEEETVAYDISDNDNTNSDDNNEEETTAYDISDNDNTKSDNSEVEMVPPEEIQYVTRYGRKVKNNLKNEYQYQTFC